MAQPISPMIWNKAAIEDNRLLPARYSIGIFTGKGVKIANNQEAYAYDDILVSDRIFDYDDRRLNGLTGPGSAEVAGRDGWGASAYGPFQTVRFTRRVFTSGQHKSIAWRVFDEKQYHGEIGDFGNAKQSSAYTGGEAYMSTAETINKAKAIWDKEILGPHIDKYNFFAIANGHISGRFVQTHANEGAMFDCDGQWIASPGCIPAIRLPFASVPYAPLLSQPTSTAAAMPASMLPAMEKFSTHVSCFFSASHTNSAITAAETAATISGVRLPVKVKRPFPETKPPI